MGIDYIRMFTFILEIILFLILMVIFKHVFKYLKRGSYKVLNPQEYFPEEEVHTLRQAYYLIMMGLLFVNVLYTVVYIRGDFLPFTIFDILLSLYIASKLDWSSWKNRILLILLIPFGSLTYIIFSNTLIGIMDFIHVPVFIYFIKMYYDRFREYTESNGLGITVILLFAIIFISFFITQVAERVNPLDAIEMVSNAFTSNGYAILGSSSIGKITAIFLVWGGYLLSGVGTATLTAAILKRHFDLKNEELYNKMESMDEKIEKLEALLENTDED